MPRPPIQHHRIYLELPQEWEYVMDRLREIVAIQAAGRASAGRLSNPNRALLVGGGLLAVIAGVLGKDMLVGLMRYFSSASTIFNPESDREEKSIAANQMINFLKDIIPFGFLIPEARGRGGGGPGSKEGSR